MARWPVRAGLGGMAVLASIALTAAPSAIAAGQHDCGSITVKEPNQQGKPNSRNFTYHDVTVSRITCGYARNFLKQLPTGGPPVGWTSKSVTLHSGRYRHEVIWHHSGGKSLVYKYSNNGR